jgi:hypothetical protein
MLPGTIRHYLNRNDAQLALQLLVRREPSEREALETALRDHGIDALLDHPALGDAVQSQDEGCFVSLPLFTYVMVRRGLREADEHDRRIADFVASLLLHFAERDRAHRIRPHDDVVYNTLADLAADAECGDPTRAFLARAQMGHLALWLAGLFPDWIEERHHRRGGPALAYYDEMGQRGYLMASQHRLAAQHGVQEILGTVGERFPRLRIALNRVSDRIFFPGYHSADKLLRQVRDEARWQ